MESPAGCDLDRLRLGGAAIWTRTKVAGKGRDLHTRSHPYHPICSDGA